MTNNDLREKIRDLRNRMGLGRGLAAMQKKLECEIFLHDLKEDAKGPRTLRKEESMDLRAFLRFVLRQAEGTLARKNPP